MSDDSEKKTNKPDLSALTEFQFGPEWARNKGSFSTKEYSKKEYKGHDRDRAKSDFRRDGDRKGGSRPFNRERGDRREKREFSADRPFSPRRPGREDGRDRRDGRNGRFERPSHEPAAGIRVEIRPINAGLASIAAEVQKHKRCFSLLDLAKVFMGARDRYEIWYIKEENGPEMIVNKKMPSVWLDEKEALSSLWDSPWFSDFYEERIEEVEAPKGQFTAIARCGMSNTLIGPVNWHGYQVALAKLHAERFPNVPFEKFRSRLVIEKSEEIVTEWLESATKRSVWVAKREGAEETVLSNRTEVEMDFKANHFNDIFEKTTKCYVPGNITGKQLAPGLFAHLLKQVEIARRHPSHIIPNVCHGLARHHLPIFKWNGGHHTGPSRPHSLPSDTQLAERPAAIIEWILSNPGGGVDVMITTLAAQAEENGTVISEESTTSSVPKATEASPSPDRDAISEETKVAEEPTTAKEETSDAISEEALEPTESTLNENSSIGENYPTVKEEIQENQISAPEENQSETEAKDQPSEKTNDVPPSQDSTDSIQPKTNLDRLQEAFISDMMWLLQQGFIIVTAEGKAYYPKEHQQISTASAQKKPKKGKAKKTVKPDKVTTSESSEAAPLEGEKKKVKRTTLKKGKEKAVTEKSTPPATGTEPSTEETPVESDQAISSSKEEQETTSQPVQEEQQQPESVTSISPETPPANDISESSVQEDDQK